MKINLYPQNYGDNPVTSFCNHPIFKKHNIKPFLLIKDGYYRMVFLDIDRDPMSYFKEQSLQPAPFEKLFTLNNLKYIDKNNCFKISKEQIKKLPPFSLFRKVDSTTSKKLNSIELMEDFLFDFLHRNQDTQHSSKDISLTDCLFLQLCEQHFGQYNSQNTFKKYFNQIYQSDFDVQTKYNLTSKYTFLNELVDMLWSQVTALENLCIKNKTYNTLVQNVFLLEYSLTLNSKDDSRMLSEARVILEKLRTSDENYKLTKELDLCNSLIHNLEMHSILDKMPEYENLFYKVKENASVFDNIFVNQDSFPYNENIHISKTAILNNLEPHQKLKYTPYLCTNLFLSMAKTANQYLNYEKIDVFVIENKKVVNGIKESDDTYQISIGSHTPIDKEKFQLFFKNTILAYKQLSDIEFDDKMVSTTLSEIILNLDSPSISSSAPPKIRKF